ncbi:uncharacterized protein isoform X2 [Leptinotarsa decemlineata]|uniref:uncharacterized protein isoform X2 n=1 Tax=Leptinotarsa decemlineata TaxID=7539 RepID=UPI003D30C13D
MPVTCIVVSCGSRNNKDKIGFYSVPTVSKHKFLTDKNELSKKRRALWLAAIKRDDLTDSKIKYQKVCSRHFITGKPASLEDETNPDWVPSQNMGHSAQNVRKTDKEVERKTSDNEDLNQLPLDSKHQKKEEIPSVFQRLCMICLATKRLIRSTKSLVDLYVHLTNIEVEDGDVFSKYMCEDCIQKLKDISKFILMAKKNDEKLKQKPLDNEEMKTSVNDDEETLDGEEKNLSECQGKLMIEVEKSEKELIEKDKDIYKDITCWKCGVLHIGVKFPKIIAYEPPNNIKFQCLKCSEIENRPDKKPPDVMNLEKLTKEEKKIRCSICLKNIPLSEYMKHRLKEHRMEKRFRCTECFLSFSNQRLLRGHSRRHI